MPKTLPEAMDRLGLARVVEATSGKRIVDIGGQIQLARGMIITVTSSASGVDANVEDASLQCSLSGVMNSKPDANRDAVLSLMSSALNQYAASYALFAQRFAEDTSADGKAAVAMAAKIASRLGEAAADKVSKLVAGNVCAAAEVGPEVLPTLEAPVTPAAPLQLNSASPSDSLIVAPDASKIIEGSSGTDDAETGSET